MGGWCRRVEHVDSEQVVRNWFRQIGATDPRFVGDKGEQGPPDWVIRYEGNTIAVEVRLLRDEQNGWPRHVEMGIEDKLCKLVEQVSREHGSPLAWQVWCEYAPEQPRRTMKASKWENRALRILRSAASAAPVPRTDRLLAKEKTRDYGWGVFLEVIAAPAKQNSGLVQVSVGQGHLVNKSVIENASSAIDHKAKKLRGSIDRGERSRLYDNWWLVFDDELVRVPILEDDEWKSIHQEIRGCLGIEAWSKVVLVNRFQPRDTTRPTNKWYHALWEDPGHAPLPPSPAWGSVEQE
jgi:hypothetical protein